MHFCSTITLSVEYSFEPISLIQKMGSESEESDEFCESGDKIDRFSTATTASFNRLPMSMPPPLPPILDLYHTDIDNKSSFAFAAFAEFAAYSALFVMFRNF